MDLEPIPADMGGAKHRHKQTFTPSVSLEYYRQQVFDKVPGENLQTLNKRDHCLALGLELLTFLQ